MRSIRLHLLVPFRICPGKEFADSTLYIVIAMTVATFDISKAKDALGNDIEPLREYVTGTIRCVRCECCNLRALITNV